MNKFIVTNEEFEKLQKEFGQLCYFISWQLLKKNVKNNHTEDMQDISQNLQMSMLRAGVSYKRQCYIERSFELCKEYAKDEFLVKLLNELWYLWSNRKNKGKTKTKFSANQEELLDTILKKVVPSKQIPNPSDELEVDEKFINYCKSIMWNEQKSIGKKITRERSIRSSSVSLSEFSHLS